MVRLIFMVIFTFSIFSTSCVSKKKHLQTLTNHKQENQDYENKITLLNGKIVEKNKEIDTLTLLNAKLQGANEALLMTQDKLQDRIDEVQAQIVATQKDKSSTAQELNAILAEKDQMITKKEEQLTTLETIIQAFEEKQNQLLGEFRWELQSLGNEKYSVDYTNSEIRISFADDLLFRPESARVRTAGIANLQKIADLINKYPTLTLYVVGNTDNRKAKNYRDNWDFSVIRASNVVKILTDEYELSPSRVIAAGKGEFSPRASNDTKKGQAENRRIDFVVLPRMDQVIKDMKKTLRELKGTNEEGVH